jgi:DNA (cytosine-5)-methyltransferase 1
MEAVRIRLPITASMENVENILNDKLLDGKSNREYLQEVVAKLLELQYQVRIMVLNAVHYGVPQNRKRMLLFASKKGFPLPQVPVRTHSHNNQYVTPKDVLDDLCQILPLEMGSSAPEEYDSPITIPGKPLPLYHHVAIPKYWYSNFTWGNIYHLESDTPTTSAAVRRRNSILHYQCDRPLTVRERARLQTFADVYRFSGTEMQQYDQIGNAVPVKLALAVAKSIHTAYQKYNNSK